jgi:hypothetical protein
MQQEAYMKRLDIELESGLYRLMRCLILAIIMAAMASHAPAQAVRPEVQKARAVYTKAKNDFVKAKDTVLRLEKEIKALDKARPRPMLTVAGPPSSAAEAAKAEKRRLLFSKKMRTYVGKQAKKHQQYNAAIEQINRSQKAFSDAAQALQLAIWSPPPPILQSVTLRTQSYSEVYAGEWKLGFSEEMQQKITEQQRLLSKIEARINARIAARKPFVEKLKTYNDTYSRNSDAYTNNTYWEIGTTSFIEGAGMIAEVFMGDEPAAAVDISAAIGAIFVKWVVNTKPDYDYVRDLQKFIKTKNANTQSASETFTDSFTGDAIETMFSHPMEQAIKCLHLDISSGGKIEKKAMEGLVSDTIGKGAAKSIGFGMAVAAIKGMVGAYFRHEANVAKRESFEAFVGGAFIQKVLNKSYQRDAPYFNARAQLRKNILELTQQANCAKGYWTKTASQSRPLISTDLKDGLQLSLTFSSPINRLPKVSVQGVNIAIKPGGAWPTSSFSGKLTAPAPQKDGTYDYHLVVKVIDPDLFDGDPKTIATFDPKKSVWDQAEPVDKGHVFKVVSHVELIKELKGYKKELQDYIIYMDKRFAYNPKARAFLFNRLSKSGVNWAAKEYTQHWNENASWPWQISNISARKYLNAHVDALGNSVYYLPGMSNIKPAEIQQFRTGMDNLRVYMKMTKAAFEDCWISHNIKRGLLWDKSKKEFKQYMDTPITIDGKTIDEAAKALREKLLKQSRETSKQADKEGKVAVACLKDVLVNPKAHPAFVSLSQLRKSSK